MKKNDDIYCLKDFTCKDDNYMVTFKNGYYSIRKVGRKNIDVNFATIDGEFLFITIPVEEFKKYFCDIKKLRKLKLQKLDEKRG